MIVLIEMLLHKIETLFNVTIVHKNDELEVAFTPCLSGKAVKIDDKIGWRYEVHKISERDLKKRGSFKMWWPTELTDVQHAVFVKLAQDGSIPIDAELGQFATSTGHDIEGLVQSLVDTHLVAREGDRLYLTTERLDVLIVPGFGNVAAENNRDQLTEWLSRRMNAR